MAARVVLEEGEGGVAPIAEAMDNLEASRLAGLISAITLYAPDAEFAP